MNITTLTNMTTLVMLYGPAALSAVLWVYMLVSKRGKLETPNTPNQDLIEAAIRAASGFLTRAHGNGSSLTNPAVIADAIGTVDQFLKTNWQETAAKANATPADLTHIASYATAAAVESLVPVLQSEVTAALTK